MTGAAMQLRFRYLVEDRDRHGNIRIWVDTTSSHGRLVLNVLASISEFERELIHARMVEGRKRATSPTLGCGARQMLASRPSGAETALFEWGSHLGGNPPDLGGKVEASRSMPESQSLIIAHGPTQPAGGRLNGTLTALRSRMELGRADDGVCQPCRKQQRRRFHEHAASGGRARHLINILAKRSPATSISRSISMGCW
jgi:hypothetical protein